MTGPTEPAPSSGGGRRGGGRRSGASRSIECRDIAQTFATRDGGVEALAGVTFRTDPHEFLCIVGPSGCGKTTLLRILAGLLPPTGGELVFHGTPDGARPRAALVFQEDGLFPWMSLVDNVAFGLETRSVPRRERRDQARDFLSRIGLHRFADRYPHELSVGMRQRGAIARAFLIDPDVLLMDEPLGALDAQTKLVLQRELLRTWQIDRKLVVYVTHDIREAVLLGDRLLVMTGHPGRIREEIPIPLDRPRDLAGLDMPEATEIVRHVWSLLEDEVTTGLGLPGT